MEYAVKGMSWAKPSNFGLASELGKTRVACSTCVGALGNLAGGGGGLV